MRSPTSRSNWPRVLLHEVSASQIGLPCSAARTGLIQPNMSFAAEKFHPMSLASALISSTSLAALSTFRTSSSPPDFVFNEFDASSRLCRPGVILLS